jgi:LPXTG-motif cell wall-anchored protein
MDPLIVLPLTFLPVIALGIAFLFWKKKRRRK